MIKLLCVRIFGPMAFGISECYLKSIRYSCSSWSTAGELRVPRCLGQLVNVKDRLFMVGGATRSYDYQSSVLNSMSSIDEYCFEKEEWEHVTDMDTSRHDMGVAVVGRRIIYALYKLRGKLENSQHTIRIMCEFLILI